MSLKDDLMEIRGIGDAKAEAVLDVLDERESDTVPRDVAERAYTKLQSGRTDLATDALERALGK